MILAQNTNPLGGTVWTEYTPPNRLVNQITSRSASTSTRRTNKLSARRATGVSTDCASARSPPTRLPVPHPPTKRRRHLALSSDWHAGKCTIPSAASCLLDSRKRCGISSEPGLSGPGATPHHRRHGQLSAPVLVGLVCHGYASFQSRLQLTYSVVSYCDDEVGQVFVGLGCSAMSPFDFFGAGASLESNPKLAGLT